MKNLILICLVGLMGMQINANILEDNKDKPECLRPWGNNAKDSLLNRQIYFYYQSSMEARKYEAAYKYWQQVMTNIPCAMQTPYYEASELFDTLISRETDVTRKVVLRDSLYLSYDRRIKYFGNKGVFIGQKGLEVRKHEPRNYKKAYALLSEAVTLQGDKVGYDLPYDMLRCSYYMYKKKQRSMDLVIADYIKLSAICSKGIDAGGEDAQTWIYISGYLDKLAGKLLTCDQIKEIFKPKLEASPDDIETKMTVVKLMKAKECMDDPMYISVLTEVIDKEPSEAGYAELSNYYKNKGNASKSNVYLEKAADLTEDNSRKENYYLRIAANSLNTSCSKAREYADKVLDLNPNNGNAMVLKGHAIYRCAKGAAENVFWKQCLAWVAVDYMNRAKSMDPSVADAANSAIASYRKGFPSKDDMFLNGVRVGETVTIKGTGLSTTARL